MSAGRVEEVCLAGNAESPVGTVVPAGDPSFGEQRGEGCLADMVFGKWAAGLEKKRRFLLFFFFNGDVWGLPQPPA